MTIADCQLNNNIHSNDNNDNNNINNNKNNTERGKAFTFRRANASFSLAVPPPEAAPSRRIADTHMSKSLQLWMAHHAPGVGPSEKTKPKTLHHVRSGRPPLNLFFSIKILMRKKIRKTRESPINDKQGGTNTGKEKKIKQVAASKQHSLLAAAGKVGEALQATQTTSMARNEADKRIELW